MQMKNDRKENDEKVNMMKNDRRQGEDLKYEKPTMKNVSNVRGKLKIFDEKVNMMKNDGKENQNDENKHEKKEEKMLKEG